MTFQEKLGLRARAARRAVSSTLMGNTDEYAASVAPTGISGDLTPVSKRMGSVNGILSEFFCVLLTCLCLGMIYVTVVRLPGGGEAFAYPTLFGALALAGGWSVAFMTTVGIFTPTGGASFSIIADVVVLSGQGTRLGSFLKAYYPQYSQLKRESIAPFGDSEWVHTAYRFGLTLVFWVFRVIAAICGYMLVWAFLGADVRTGYNGALRVASGIGLGITMPYNGAASVWSTFVQFLVALFIAFWFKTAILFFMHQHKEGRRVKWNNDGVLAIGGVVFALTLIFVGSGLQVPRFFPTQELGSWTTHSFATVRAEARITQVPPDPAALCALATTTVDYTVNPWTTATFTACKDAVANYSAYLANTRIIYSFRPSERYLTFNMTPTPPTVEATISAPDTLGTTVPAPYVYQVAIWLGILTGCSLAGLFFLIYHAMYHGLPRFGEGESFSTAPLS